MMQITFEKEQQVENVDMATETSTKIKKRPVRPKKLAQNLPVYIYGKPAEYI